MMCEEGWVPWIQELLRARPRAKWHYAAFCSILIFPRRVPTYIVTHAEGECEDPLFSADKQWHAKACLNDMNNTAFVSKPMISGGEGKAALSNEIVVGSTREGAQY